jgi:hypothetical protein
MRLTLVLTLVLASPLMAQRGRSVDGDAWKVLAARYDKDGDGQITAKEYTRGPGKFIGYDANLDGVLTEADFEGTGGMDFGRMMLGRSLRAADGDEDGRISAEEWSAWLTSLGADADGVIPPDAVPRLEEGRRGGRSASLDRDRDGAVTLADLAIVHAMVDLDGDGVLTPNELDGRPSREGAPTAGTKAPDFELAFAKDPERKVRLSSFVGQRPVALIFGSYT